MIQKFFHLIFSFICLGISPIFAQKTADLLKSQIWELKGYEQNGTFFPQSLMENRSQFSLSKGTNTQSIADFFLEGSKGHLYATVDNMDGTYSIDWYDSLQIIENEALTKLIFINPDDSTTQEATLKSLSKQELKYQIEDKIWVWQKHQAKILEEKWNKIFLKALQEQLPEQQLSLSIGIPIKGNNIGKAQILKSSQPELQEKALAIASKIDFMKIPQFEQWLAEKALRYESFLMVLSQE